MSSEHSDPWPVWEDSYINTFKWTDKPGTPLGTSEGREMPPSIHVASWERPSYDERKIEWTMSAEDTPLDLITNNSHLIKYKVMTTLMSSIQSLEELGRNSPFEPDYQGPAFYYNGGPYWKPWNHIYTYTRAGKGTTHSLRINKGGFYFVRLYYMGHWRRITVDDYLPYNEEKELLLPCSKNRFNIWIQILAKALFQVASLSWTPYDEMKDFNIITCLTGWTYYPIDCRMLSIDAVWNVIQMYLIEGPKCQETTNFCLTTSSQTCLTSNVPYLCYDSKYFRTIFASVLKTENELQKLSPAEEHVLSIILAETFIKNDVEDLPPWKRFRWVDWAREHGDQRETLGIIKRNITVYSPFKKVTKINPYNVDNIRNVVKNILDGKILTGHLKELLNAEIEPKKLSMSENDGPYLCYDFSKIYPFIKELQIYYKVAQFRNTFQTNDLDRAIAPTPSTRMSQKSFYEFQKYLTNEQYSVKCFFLCILLFIQDIKLFDSIILEYSQELKKENYFRDNLFDSDSKFCKDFFITLSVFLDGSNSHRPYVTCEMFNWKTQKQGEILFDISTYGTVTHVLQLGSSVQVCRIWYDLPHHYNFMISANSPFELLTFEGIQHKLSSFTETFLFHGEKMMKAFDKLKSTTLNSPDHYKLLNGYKKSLFPPVFESLSEDEKMMLTESFIAVFDECLAELIFEESTSITTLASNIEVYKVLFNNEKAFEGLIKTLSDEEQTELQLTQENIYNSLMRHQVEVIVKDLTQFQKERGIEAEPSLKAMFCHDNKTNESTIIKKSFNEVKLEDSTILSNSHNNVKLLRKVLDKNKKYLNLYPFKNEHELHLAYLDYSGASEFTPVQRWVLIGRLLLNVHSKYPVPCNLNIKTNLALKVTLLLFDIEASKFLEPSYAINKTYYVSRTKVGYALLMYVVPTENMIKLQQNIKWKLRITGTNKGNVLHPCYKSPLICKSYPTEPHEIYSQCISGFYFPNSENIIGRFQIKTKSSPIITMFISIARSDLWIRVVVRAGDSEICSVESKGSALVPLLLIDQNNTGNSPSDQEMYYIVRGEIQLIDKWILNKEESLFVHYLRVLPQKDILSFEDFQAFAEQSAISKDDFLSGDMDDEKDSKGDPDAAKYSQLKKNIVDSDSSDDFEFYTEREFESINPFGLLSFSPYWRATVFVDEMNKEDTLLSHDDHRLREFEMFKISWEENDPGRRKKGEELRTDFLKYEANEFIKNNINSDCLDISDYSECGIEEGRKNQFDFSPPPTKKKTLLKRRKTKKDQSSSFVNDDIALDGLRIMLRKSQTELSDNFSNLDQSKNKQSNYRESSVFKSLRPSVVSEYQDTHSILKMSKLRIKRPELFDKSILPSISLCVCLPPILKLSSVIEFYNKFCTEDNDDKSFSSKTITGILLKKYSKPHFNEFKNYDTDEFQFGLPEEYTSLSFKDIRKIIKEDGNWEYITSEIIEPILYPITKRELPCLTQPRPERLSNFNFRKVEEHYFALKREADDHLQGIREKMISIRLIQSGNDITNASPRIKNKRKLRTSFKMV